MRIELPADSRLPKFAVNSMLGKLARWLRILGYDAAYWRGTDEDLIQKALRERRILVTTDRALAARARRMRADVVSLDQGMVAEMLAGVARQKRISLVFDEKVSRCPACNSKLEGMCLAGSKRWICGGCGKDYWVGTHWKGIETKLKQAASLLEGQRPRR